MTGKVSKFKDVKHKAKNRNRLKMALIFSALILIFATGWLLRADLAYLYYIVSANYNGFKHGAKYPKSFLGEHLIRLQNFNNNVMLICENSTKIYSITQASRIFNINHNFSSGEVKNCNKRIAVFDYMSGNISIYDCFKKIWNEQGKRAIYDVELSHDGLFAILGDASHYISCARVFNSENKQILTWNCADGYVMNAAFSPNSKNIAIVSLTSCEGTIKSTVTRFDLNSGKLENSFSIPDLILDIIYPSSDKIAIITRNGVYIMNKYLNVTEKYDFENEELLQFSYSDKLIALCFQGYNNGDSSRIVALNYSGKLLGSAEVAGSAQSLKVDENNVGVLIGEKVFLFNKNMKIKKTYEFNTSIYDFLIIGRYIFAINTDELIRIDL